MKTGKYTKEKGRSEREARQKPEKTREDRKKEMQKK